MTLEMANNLTPNQPAADTKARLKALIEQLSAYIEHFHGGSVEFIGYEGSTVTVRLGGACLGCPLLPSTLHGWVQGTIQQFFPEITEVKSIE
jgi:Fe-S cluster biogenesis protein NfuA